MEGTFRSRLLLYNINRVYNIFHNLSNILTRISEYSEQHLHHLLVDGLLVRPDPLGGEQEEEAAQQQQGEGQVQAALDREEVDHLGAVRAVRFPNLTHGHIYQHW